MGSKRRGATRSGKSENSAKRSSGSGESGSRRRDPPHIHVPLEDLQFQVLQGRRSERDDERVVALRNRVEEPPHELEDGVERIVRHEVFNPVQEDGSAGLLRHEILDLVHNALERRRDRLLLGPFSVREPQNAFGGEGVTLPHPPRIRAGDDQAAAPATEELCEEAESLRGTFLLYQVAAAWSEVAGPGRQGA